MRHDPWENQVNWGTDPGSMVPFGFVFHLNSKTKLLPWKLHVVRIVHEAVVVGCSTADEVPKIQLGRAWTGSIAEYTTWRPTLRYFGPRASTQIISCLHSRIRFDQGSVLFFLLRLTTFELFKTDAQDLSRPLPHQLITNSVYLEYRINVGQGGVFGLLPA
jgi:hypothetical protein